MILTTRMLRSLILLAGAFSASAQQYTISTVAGGAPPSTPAPALTTGIGSPRKIMFAGGSLYFADTGNNRVRMVNPQGVISTFAGNGNAGVPGFWGDGGLATDALIHSPVAIATDKNGNVYIVASADNTVRIVDPNG